MCLTAIPARERLIPKNVQGISPNVRLRKKKPFSLAHVGCIPSPETLLAAQRLLARADFFWLERNLGSDDGVDWSFSGIAATNQCFSSRPHKNFCLAQKLAPHVKLATEQDAMLFSRLQVQDVDLLPASGRCTDLEKLACLVTTNVDDNLRRLFRRSLPIPAHSKRRSCGFDYLHSCTHPGKEPI